MTWIDFVIILIIVAVVVVEMIRGFFPALLWAGGEYLVLLISGASYKGMAASVRLAQAPTTNESVWFLLLFILLSALAFWGSHYLSHVVPLEIGDAFEQILGIFFGFVCAVIISHAFTRMLEIGYAQTPAMRNLLLQSSLGKQALTFEVWHNFIKFMSQWQKETGA